MARRNHSQYWLQPITVVMFKKQLWRRHLRKRDRESVISRIPLRKRTRKKNLKNLSWWRESHKFTHIFKWPLLRSLHQARKGMCKSLNREKEQNEGKIEKGEKQRKQRTGRLERLKGTSCNSHLNPQITSKLTEGGGSSGSLKWAGLCNHVEQNHSAFQKEPGRMEHLSWLLDYRK